MIDKGDTDFSYLAGDLANNPTLVALLLIGVGVALIVLVAVFGRIWKPTRRH